MDSVTPMKDGGQGPRETSEILDAAALFRAHSAFVAAFIRRLGVHEGDVDDGVQEVFLIAHNKGGYTPGPASPRSWLGAIAVRVAANSRRRRSRRREDDSPGALDGQIARSNPEASVEQRESLVRVQKALNELDVEHRAVFVLFELEGESCAGIAEALQVPTGTVYSRLHTARKRFVAAYEGMTGGAV